MDTIADALGCGPMSGSAKLRSLNGRLGIVRTDARPWVGRIIAHQNKLMIKNDEVTVACDVNEVLSIAHGHAISIITLKPLHQMREDLWQK